MNLKQYLKYKNWTPLRMSEETKRADAQGVSVSAIRRILDGHVPSLRSSLILKRVIEADTAYSVRNMSKHNHAGITQERTMNGWRTVKRIDCLGCRGATVQSKDTLLKYLSIAVVAFASVNLVAMLLFILRGL